MIIKGLIDEDFVNYKIPCMTIEFPRCSFKCDKECGKQVCQNGRLATAPEINIDENVLIERYINNPITKAIVCQGLEPLDSFEDVLTLLDLLRHQYGCDDDFVIYTGYNKDEIKISIQRLKLFNNVVIKYGRYVPDQSSHYDEVVGVNLASDNQYAERL